MWNAQNSESIFRQALTALTPIRRRVFLLYYHHELPIKVIAAEIGRSEGTIKTHLRNARLQLQEFLIPYLEKSTCALARLNVCVLRISGLFGFRWVFDYFKTYV